MLDTHFLDLFWLQETELNLLDGLERRTRVREVKVRHSDRTVSSLPRCLTIEAAGLLRECGALSPTRSAF